MIFLGSSRWFASDRILFFRKRSLSMPESASPEPISLLQDIESRQDEVLRLLDDLEAQLQRTLREGQIHLAPQSMPAARAA